MDDVMVGACVPLQRLMLAEGSLSDLIFNSLSSALCLQDAILCCQVALPPGVGPFAKNGRLSLQRRNAAYLHTGTFITVGCVSR